MTWVLQLGTTMTDRLYLDLRGQTYWYIRKVPMALKAKMLYPHTGKAHYRVNLKTGDIRHAQRQRNIINVAFDAEVSAARKRRAGIQEDALIVEVTTLRRWVADAVNKGDADARQSVAEDIALENAEKLEGKFGDDFAARYYQTATNTRPGTEIDAYLDNFIAQNPARPHTNYRRKKVINDLAAWRSGLFVEVITRDIARQFVDEVIAPGRKPETINGDLGVLSSYWKWLSDQGYVNDSCANHWTRFRRKSEKKELDDRQRAYSDDEMRLLFRSTKPMRLDLLDCATISAMSGARLEEVGSLKVKDADLKALTLFLPGTKTEAAPRKIPLHADLVSIFSRRAEGKAPSDWVFHELPIRKSDALKGRAAKISQAFTRFRRSVGIGHTAEAEERSPVDFHSFRRWFATQLRKHNTPDRLIDGICGWTRADMQDRYTWSADVFGQMREAVANVKMP